MFDTNNSYFIFPHELSQKLVEKGISPETHKHALFFTFMDIVNDLASLCYNIDRIEMESCLGRIGMLDFII